MSDGSSGSFPALGSGLRWLSVAFAVLGGFAFAGVVIGLVMMVVVSAGKPPSNELMAFLVIAGGLLVLALYGQMFIGPIWIHQAWSWLPGDERYARHWQGWISPGQAAGLLCIPYFQYYWMFVINCGLCDSLDRLRARYPTRTGAPKGIAIAACISQLLVPFPVGAILWIVFMARVEAMTAEMAQG